jgi:plastocyanin
MKKLFFFLLLSAFSIASYSTVWQVTNSGFTFSPATLTIHLGDSVNFTLAASHDALEVSQATWNANGTTPLAGGFQTPFGGGMVPAAKLGIGVHYYVCENHASSGMKGTITVQDNAGIANNLMPIGISVYPNPSSSLLTLRSDNDLAGSHYFICDLAGRQVLTGTLASDVTQVDISQLISGIYLIRVDGQKRSSVKFIKN